MQKTLLVFSLALGCLCSPALSEPAGGNANIGRHFRRLAVSAAGRGRRREPRLSKRTPGWQSVDLPHTWNTKDTFDDVPGYYRGIGWYRKQFAVPESWKGKRIVLRFEAACSVATVWVNGELLGQHKGS